jgi:hypothetical protein
MKNAKTPSLNTTDPLPQNLKSLLSQTRFEKMVFFQRPARTHCPGGGGVLMMASFVCWIKSLTSFF